MVQTGQLPQIGIFEPSPRQKRRQVSMLLLGRGGLPDLEAIRSRLKRVREHSLSEQQSLAERFGDTLRASGLVSFCRAATASEAIDYIARIAGGTRHVAVNRSSVVMNELAPGLRGRGFNVLEPYFSEFDAFQNSMAEPRDLPGLVSKGLAGSFELSDSVSLLSGRVEQEGDRKELVAVLGVNAAAAEDGSIFFLQHMPNISRTLGLAGTVVLVVGLDKIVATSEDAAFQTECMGIFGMESMLLGLRPAEGHPGAEMSDLPDRPSGGVPEWHVIVLDNGRSGLVGGPQESLLLCIGCRACLRQCPIGRHMTGGGDAWSPRDYLFSFLLGEVRSMDACLHCESCRVECPLGIDIPGLMWVAEAQRRPSLQERLLGRPRFLARLGSLAAPVSNLVAQREPAKSLVMGAMGLDRSRRLPRFRRRSFGSRFAGSGAGDAGGTAQRKVAYFSGCFANYYQPEVADALVDVLRRNGVEVVFPDQECCGLPMVANRNESGALRNARLNVESLAELVKRGYDVVTACPSCSLMIRHEYPLMCVAGGVELVSEHTYYVEEYLMMLHERGELDIGAASLHASVFYHVPCHLKVQDLRADAMGLLPLVPGLSVRATSGVCCGMGGYHGFKKKHSRLSIELGGKLFQEVGEAGADMVVTACAACAMQIEAGAGVTVTHPVVLLQEAYARSGMQLVG